MKNEFPDYLVFRGAGSGLVAAALTTASYRCAACWYPKDTAAGWCGRCRWFTAGRRCDPTAPEEDGSRQA